MQFATATTKSELGGTLTASSFVKQSKLKFALNEKHLLCVLSLDVAVESTNNKTNPAWKVAGQICKLDSGSEKGPSI